MCHSINYGVANLPGENAIRGLESIQEYPASNPNYKNSRSRSMSAPFRVPLQSLALVDEFVAVPHP